MVCIVQNSAVKTLLYSDSNRYLTDLIIKTLYIAAVISLASPFAWSKVRLPLLCRFLPSTQSLWVLMKVILIVHSCVTLINKLVLRQIFETFKYLKNQSLYSSNMYFQGILTVCSHFSISSYIVTSLSVK